MSNSNLFYSLYSRSNDTISSGYVCSSAIDENDTSFDITDSAGVITDSNGNTLAEIDLSQVHAEGVSQYTTETRVLLPYSCCLLQGNEFGLAQASYFFRIPKVVAMVKGYQYYCLLDFDFIYNTYVPRALHIETIFNPRKTFVSQVNELLSKFEVSVSASILSLEDPVSKEMQDYLVFLGAEPGLFYFIENVKLTPLLLSEDYPDSPLSNDIENIKIAITDSMEKVLSDGTTYYDEDCDLYTFLLLSWEELVKPENVRLLYDLSVLEENYQEDAKQYLSIYKTYDMYETAPYDFECEGYYYTIDNEQGSHYFIYFGRTFTKIDIDNVVRYSQDPNTQEFYEDLNGEYIKYYNYYLILIRANLFEYEVIESENKFYTRNDNGEYIDVSTYDGDDSNEHKMILKSDYLEYIIKTNIKCTPLCCSTIWKKYTFKLLYEIVMLLYEMTAHAIFPEYFWLWEDLRRRIPLMKYPNGAYRGILIVPTWPTTTDAYDYASLYVHHVRDLVTLYHMVPGHHHVHGYPDLHVFVKKTYGVLANAIIHEEAPDIDHRGNLISNGEMIHLIPDGYEDLLHIKRRCCCKPTRLDNYDPDDIAYISQGTYARKNDVVGIYKYMQWVNENDLWNKVGDFYCIIGKADDPLSFTKNLPSSALVYNPNPIPVKMKYMIFS